MPMSCACEADEKGTVKAPCGAHANFLREYVKYRNRRITNAIGEARQMAADALFDGKTERAAGMVVIVKHLEQKNLADDY